MAYGLIGLLISASAMLAPTGAALGVAAPSAQVNLPPGPDAGKSFGFADRGLDPSDYTVYLYRSDRGRAEVSRVTGGAAGSALSLLADAPATYAGSYRSTAYFLRKGYTYDPGVQGPIDSIDFLQDCYITVETTGALEHLGGHFNSVIEQAGRYFVHSVPYTPIPGTYVAGTATALHAQDYALITNLLTFANDPAVHPDFAGPPMRFGVKVGWSVSTEYPASKADIRVSRLEYRIHRK